MIHDITTWIIHLIQTHGASAVFVGVVIESVIVPIPSPLIIMGAGVFLIQPGLSWSGALVPILATIVLPGAVASTLGAFFAYLIASWGGKRLIDRYEKFLGFSFSDVMTLEKRLITRPGLMIFLLRALPIVPLSLISAAAGLIKMPIGPFALWTFLGSIPRCILLAYLGYFVRDSWENLAGHINKIEGLVSAGIVVGAFALILYLRRKLRRT